MLLLLLFCVLPSLVVAQLDPNVLVIASASGDGTCVNTGSVALNCTMPFTLTVHVPNLKFPISYVYLYPSSGSAARLTPINN